MKFARILSAAAFVLLFAGTAMASTAYLQVIHNAPDPGAAVVDIYVNAGPEPFINDFAFRDATPYVDVPAGVPLSIGVVPGTSTGPGDIPVSFDVVLEPNQEYVAMASGVLDPAGFDPNPGGKNIAFTLFARDGIKTRSFWKTVKVIGFHGSPDAPAVDILARTWCSYRKLADDLSYGEFSGYSTPWGRVYEIAVTLADDNSAVVAKYKADLGGARSKGVTVFASGFLNSAQGPAFGLFAALPDGTVLELPAYGGHSMTALASPKPERTFALFQNSPNPFSGNTTISFALPEAADVDIKIYNAMGQVVDTILDEKREAGTNSVNFSSQNISTGVYFYRISAGPHSEVRKMMVVR